MSQVGTDFHSDQFQSRIAALEQLLSVLERTVVEQSERSGMAEARLTAIVQNADDAIITISPDLRVTSWNPAAERLIGFTREEALGRRTIELYVPPEARELVEKQIREDFATLEHDRSFVRRVERELRQKDGSLVDVSLVATGMFNSEKSSLGMSIIMRDISERKQAEREQALLASIVESSDDAIFSVSPTKPLFPIMSWNKGAERLFGFTAEEAVGRNVTELFVAPELREHASTLMKLDAASFREHPEQVRHLEVPAVRRDGTRIDIAIGVSGIYDGAGNLLAISNIARDITERRRAERVQALLASIVESSDDAIVSHSPEGRILSWNKGAEKLLGFSAAEAVGQTNLDLFVPPEDRASVQKIMQEDMERFRTDSSFVQHLEWQLRTKDDRRVDAFLTASAARDIAGNVTAISLIMRDVTERKRAEREMALLAAIVQSADAAIVSLSLDFEVQSWNAAAERLFGYAAKEAIGRHGPELFLPPSTRERALAEYLRDVESLRQPGGARYFEETSQRKDGSTFDVSLITSGIFDADGQLTGVSMIARDITEIKHAEREQQMLAAIVNASEDAIVSTSLDNTIISWNRGAEKLMGVSAKEALGRNILEFVPPEEHPRVGSRVGGLLQSGKPVNFRIHSKKKDGTVFDSWVNLFPTYDAQGNIAAIGAIGRDITEMVRLEREQAELATIVNASKDAVIGFSTDLKITSWNPAAEETYGFTAEQAIGRGFDFFVPPEELSIALEADRRLLETGQSVSFEQRARKRDGSSFISLVNSFPYSRCIRRDYRWRWNRPRYQSTQADRGGPAPGARVHTGTDRIVGGRDGHSRSRHADQRRQRAIVAAYGVAEKVPVRECFRQPFH